MTSTIRGHRCPRSSSNFTDQKTETQRPLAGTVKVRADACWGLTSCLQGCQLPWAAVHSGAGVGHLCPLNPQHDDGLCTPWYRWRDAPHPALAAPKPLQRATPHTDIKFSSRRNRFQHWKAWPELQTGTEAIHPNTALHLKAPLGELAARLGQVRSTTLRISSQVKAEPRAIQRPHHGVSTTSSSQVRGSSSLGGLT